VRVLAYRNTSFVQAANDEVWGEKVLGAVPAMTLQERMADTGHCQEPSAAAHMTATVLWQDAPIDAPA
jgi:hypothetical protein